MIASISDRKIPATNSGYGSYLSNYVMATVPGTGDLFKSPNVTNGIVSAKLITYIGAGSSHYIMIRLGTALDASLCYELEFDFDKGTLAGNDLVTAYLQDVTTANHQIGYESSAIFTGVIPATGHYRFKYKPGRGGAGIMTCLVFGLTNAQSSNFLIDNVTFRALPQVTAYNPDVLSHTDYYAFGQPMPGRNWSLDEYRYGMNGQEKDNEVFKGAMTAEYWEYDSRIGRRWEQDPITYPWQSPYATFNNNPIYYSDPSGLEGDPPGKKRRPTDLKSGFEVSTPPEVLAKTGNAGSKKETVEYLPSKTMSLPVDALRVNEPNITISEGASYRDPDKTSEGFTIMKQFTSEINFHWDGHNSWITYSKNPWVGQDYMRYANFDPQRNIDFALKRGPSNGIFKGIEGSINQNMDPTLGLGPVGIGKNSGDFVLFAWNQRSEYFADIKKAQIPGSTSVLTYTNVYEFNYNSNRLGIYGHITLTVNKYKFLGPGQFLNKEKVKDTTFGGWSTPSVNYGPFSGGFGY